MFSKTLLWEPKMCRLALQLLGMLGNVLGRPRHALQRPGHALQCPRHTLQGPWPTSACFRKVLAVPHRSENPPLRFPQLLILENLWTF